MSQKFPELNGVAWQGSNLVISDPDLIPKVRRKQLSASAAQKIAQCPATHVASSLLPREEDPFGPAELGTSSHDVLEHMYERPADERVKDFIVDYVPKAAETEWSLRKLVPLDPRPTYYSHKGLDRDELKALQSEWDTRADLLIPSLSGDVVQSNAAAKQKWVDLVTKMSLTIFDYEDPTTVDVFKNEWHIRGVMLGGRVPFNGFLDRTDRACPGNDIDLLIRDYKFGKWKVPNMRFGDGYGDQMRIYTMAIELMTGSRPKEAKLIYPLVGKDRVIDLSEGAMKKTFLDFSQSWDTMNHAADEGVFPTKPGALCAWCPLANSCPVAKITSEKAIGHAKTQPSKVDLGIPVIPVAAPSAAPRKVAARVVVLPSTSTPLPDTTHETPRIGDTQTITPKTETLTMTDTSLARLYPTSEHAAMNVFRVADIAIKHLATNGQMLSGPNLHAFTEVLAGIITRVERESFVNSGWEHGKTSRLAYSLQNILTFRPAPFGQDEQAWAAWVKGIEIALTALATVALNLLAVPDYNPTAYRKFTADAVVTA